jgi:DNA-binding transcriptional MerR regulator
MTSDEDDQLFIAEIGPAYAEPEAREPRVARKVRRKAAPEGSVDLGSEKLYFKIGEVAQIVGVPAYVLRYWETEFKVIKPQKSRAQQRVYRRRDVETLLKIKHLLYAKKFTIAGARQQLRLGGDEVEMAPPPAATSPRSPSRRCGPSSTSSSPGWPPAGKSRAASRPIPPPTSRPWAAARAMVDQAAAASAQPLLERPDRPRSPLERRPEFGLASAAAKRVYRRSFRGIAQPGSALDWGSRGRRFKSSCPDNARPEVPQGPSGLYLWASVTRRRLSRKPPGPCVRPPACPAP